jgi:hypothetical protein
MLGARTSIPGMGQTRFRFRSSRWPIPGMLATLDLRQPALNLK